MVVDAGPARMRLGAAFGLFGIVVALLFIAALGVILVDSGGDESHRVPTAFQHGPAHAEMAGVHGASEFIGSFAMIGLVAIAGYLVGLAAWAFARKNWIFFVRHLWSAVTTLTLTLLYLLARGGVGYNVHNWNRAFADASVVLFAVTLGIGPLARLWRPAAAALAWRRETGIWASIAAVLHVGIYWENRFGWGGWRGFFYPRNEDGSLAPTLAGDGTSAGGFGVANAIGLVALVYALILSITSNDVSQRLLKQGWSWLMKRATTMQILVLLHTWIFAYFITHEAALAVGTLWASFWMVLLLQTAAFGKTIWVRHTKATQEPSAPDRYRTLDSA